MGENQIETSVSFNKRRILRKSCPSFTSCNTCHSDSAVVAYSPHRHHLWRGKRSRFVAFPCLNPEIYPLYNLFYQIISTKRLLSPHVCQGERRAQVYEHLVPSRRWRRSSPLHTSPTSLFTAIYWEINIQIVFLDSF